MAATGLVAGCLAGLIPAIGVLATGDAVAFRAPWNVPYGSFFLEIDALSAFFLVPILILGAVASVYGVGYLEAERDHLPARPAWFFTALLIAGMAAVVMARNAVLFLVAWEIMSMAAFFLVTLDSESDETRSAGWTYLVATHLGTAFLFALFLILGQKTGSLDFDQWGAASSVAAAAAIPPVSLSASLPVSLLFLFAVIGFGTKAGLMPFHVWLPEAHPAAPSHVSALMSGVMIKTGIYGILRTLTWLGPPPAWWGGLLIALGLVSGILGVVFALAQHNLKRLLAYHSVENIGIILLGLGVGLLGRAIGSPTLAALGFAGGLLHVVNHAVFKGLLFLAAGGVIQSAGTPDMDRLGGALKRMPWTGAAFLIGAAAISGLPPLNGFISEFLIYLGAYRGSLSAGFPPALALLGVIAGLALIGGLAAACFAKAFGMVFLGEPRDPSAEARRECGPAMRIPMAILVAACLGIGLGAPWIASAFRHVLPVVARIGEPEVQTVLNYARSPLLNIVYCSWLLILLGSFFFLLRRRLLSRRTVAKAGTWDCGYAAPTARMQYTSSSFAQPLTRMFQWALRAQVHGVEPAGLFPRNTRFETHTADVFRERLFAPAFSFLARILSQLRRVQEGRVQIYVSYVVVTLLVLLLWKL